MRNEHRLSITDCDCKLIIHKTYIKYVLYTITRRTKSISLMNHPVEWFYHNFRSHKMIGIDFPAQLEVQMQTHRHHRHHHHQLFGFYCCNATFDWIKWMSQWPFLSDRRRVFFSRAQHSSMYYIHMYITLPKNQNECCYGQYGTLTETFPPNSHFNNVCEWLVWLWWCGCVRWTLESIHH